MLRNEEIQNIIQLNPNVNIIAVLKEIKDWQQSLGRDAYDDVVFYTLDNVVDIILENCKEE